jgi:alpha-galactosidase-like CBM13-containing protein
VAFLVSPDSAVDLMVDAPAAGSYDLVIGYSNGTGAISRQGLAVNASAAGTVTYRPTQFWGLIGTVTARVTLRAGANTIRLSNAGGIADLDFVDVAFAARG